MLTPLGNRRHRPLAGACLRVAALTLAAALLAACSGSSGEEGESGVLVQALATATVRPAPSATVRPAPSATPLPPSPTPLPPTPTSGPPTATAEPATEPPPSPTLEPPAATADLASPVRPPAEGVTLTPPQVSQGGATVVQVFDVSASAAVADFAGRQYPLLGGEGTFWGVLGVPANQPPSGYPVLVTLMSADGQVLRQMQVSLTVTAAGFPVEYIQLEPATAALLDPAIVLEEIDRRAAIYAVFTPERLWSAPFLLPVQGPISGVYGAGRSYNGGPVTDYHRGTDITAEEGTPVVAANTGRVAFAGDLSVRGRSVILDHGLGVFSAYHHLTDLAVVQGQLVTKGDLVGTVGETGLAEGPHLHWEIVVRGVEVDALRWTQEEYGPVPSG